MNWNISKFTLLIAIFAATTSAIAHPPIVLLRVEDNRYTLDWDNTDAHSGDIAFSRTLESVYLSESPGFSFAFGGPDGYTPPPNGTPWAFSVWTPLFYFDYDETEPDWAPETTGTTLKIAEAYSGGPTIGLINGSGIPAPMNFDHRGGVAGNKFGTTDEHKRFSLTTGGGPGLLRIGGYAIGMQLYDPDGSIEPSEKFILSFRRKKWPSSIIPTDGPFPEFNNTDWAAAVTRAIDIFTPPSITAGTAVSASHNGVTAIFDQVDVPGQFSAVSINAFYDHSPLNTVGSVDPQVWNLEFLGEASGDISITFAYDDSALTIPEDTIAIIHVLADGTEAVLTPAPGDLDTVNNTITVTTNGFSSFYLGTAVPEPATGLLLAVACVLNTTRTRRQINNP